MGSVVAAGVGLDGRGQQTEGMEAARQAYEASDYTKAAELLRAAVAKNPQDAQAHYLLAKTYFQAEQHDAAVNSAEKAVALEPQNSAFHELLGRAYGEKADHSSFIHGLPLARKTVSEFEKAVKLDERNFSARQALVEFYCAAPGIAGGGEDKAHPEIAKLIEMDASEGHYAAGNCRRQKKDFTTADVEFAKALESHPKSADLIYDIGDYAVKRGEADRLLAVAEIGEKAAPGDPRGKFYRAVGLILKNERGDAAESLLREYLQRAPMRDGYPRPWTAHDWLGRFYEARGNTAAAIAEYEAALKLQSKDKVASDAAKRLRKS
jgi:tetratricopeptide (TPR) repeat protein